MRSFAAVLPAGCGLALWAFCCAASAEEAQVVDGIAAIVNGDVITYSQVRQLSAPRERLLRSQFTGQDLDNKALGIGHDLRGRGAAGGPANPGGAVASPPSIEHTGRGTDPGGKRLASPDTECLSSTA